MHTGAKKLFSKVKLEIRLIHLAGIKSLSDFKNSYTYTTEKTKRGSMTKKISFLPYYIPFYSSYLTKLNLYKFVHIALKELFTSLKNEQNIRNIKLMVPFAIFVQSISIYQLKAFERYENNPFAMEIQATVPPFGPPVIGTELVSIVISNAKFKFRYIEM